MRIGSAFDTLNKERTAGFGKGTGKGKSMSSEELWEELLKHQGQVFHTVKGLEFRYEVIGGEIFVDRRSKTITRATMEKALEKVQTMPETVTGPKSLGVFGAPYVWAIFRQFGVTG